MHSYKIHLHKEPEGGYTVIVPALSGCITYGENVDEAIEMAREAIEIYTLNKNLLLSRIL